MRNITFLPYYDVNVIKLERKWKRWRLVEVVEVVLDVGETKSK